jgi:hypothetical protein
LLIQRADAAAGQQQLRLGLLVHVNDARGK